MARSEPDFLDIRLFPDLDQIWRRVPLTDALTYLGRPEVGQPGVNLEFLWVSRQHACVERHERDGKTTYTLRNVNGRAGIRLYEHLLMSGDSRPLLHSYTFQIPGTLEKLTSPHLLITLCVGSSTTRLAIVPSLPPYFVIFGEPLRFTPKGYSLLSYLYQHKDAFCPYAELIAALWTPKPRTPERIRTYQEHIASDLAEYESRKENLESLLARVRGKIRKASGGVELIQTIHSEGLCLHTSCISRLCQDSAGHP
ncbi:MAG: hypothetical protein HGA19_24000 [Oscillochloris sp.]|nr:hypothetical protein [Oscillochloris sp.]